MASATSAPRGAIQAFEEKVFGTVMRRPRYGCGGKDIGHESTQSFMHSHAAHFETSFVDPQTGADCTFRIKLGEPVLHHPSHLIRSALAQPLRMYANIRSRLQSSACAMADGSAGGRCADGGRGKDVDSIPKAERREPGEGKHRRGAGPGTDSIAQRILGEAGLLRCGKVWT